MLNSHFGEEGERGGEARRRRRRRRSEEEEEKGEEEEEVVVGAQQQLALQIPTTLLTAMQGCTYTSHKPDRSFKHSK